MKQINETNRYLSVTYRREHDIGVSFNCVTVVYELLYLSL